MITEADIPKPNSSSAEKAPRAQDLYGAELAMLQDESAHLNPRQLARSINEHLFAQIAQDAEAGKLTKRVEGENGQTSEHVYSAEEIFAGQLNGFLRLHDADHTNKESFLHIPRAGGLRSTVRTIFENPRLVEPFKVALIYRQEEMRQAAEQARVAAGNAGGAEVSAAQRIVGVEGNESDSERLEAAIVAQELGEEAVEQVVDQPDKQTGSVVESAAAIELRHQETVIEARLSELSSHLSQEDQTRLWAFAVSMDNEIPYAQSRLSQTVRSSVDIFGYRNLMKQLSAVRAKIRDLDK